MFFEAYNLSNGFWIVISSVFWSI